MNWFTTKGQTILKANHAILSISHIDRSHFLFVFFWRIEDTINYFRDFLIFTALYYCLLIPCGPSMMDYPETHRKPLETGRSGFWQVSELFFINKKFFKNKIVLIKSPETCRKPPQSFFGGFRLFPDNWRTTRYTAGMAEIKKMGVHVKGIQDKNSMQCCIILID